MVPNATLDPSWVLRLRTASVAGITFLVILADLAMGFDLPKASLGVLLIGWQLTVLGTHVWHHTLGRPIGERGLTALLILDALLLTGVFHQTGGPSNPFNFFYLVHLALAAIALPTRAVWVLAVLSSALFGLLFLDHVPLVMDPMPGHGGHGGMDGGHDMESHLRGMWLAFTVSAGFIVFFVSRLARALETQERALAEVRTRAERSARLASLATMSAGAAHELATPLSTIAIVAKELEHDLAQMDGTDAAIEDVRLVGAQVERCREVLEHLRVDAGDPAGEPRETIALGELVERAIVHLDARDRVDVVVPEDAAPLTTWPRSLARALRGLVKNALDATPAPAHVQVRVHDAHDQVVVDVVDQGSGMAPETLARVGDPFFTTKPSGSGMGLGVFLARSLADRLGGDLTYTSAPGEGTTATLSLPRSAPSMQDHPA